MPGFRVGRLLGTALLTALLCCGLAAPASADVSIRDAKVADLYVRAATPSATQLERQYMAFLNPNLPLNPKYEVSYRGDTPQVRDAISRFMAYSRTYDFFAIKGRAAGAPQISGNRMTIGVDGVAAGFPALSFKAYYIRDDGLWKFDWKAICDGSCGGNPDFGY